MLFETLALIVLLSALTRAVARRLSDEDLVSCVTCPQDVRASDVEFSQMTVNGYAVPLCPSCRKSVQATALSSVARCA